MTVIKPVQIVVQRAHDRAADFIEKHVATALVFRRKRRLQQYVASMVSGDGLCIECGVFEGASINFVAGLLPDRTFFGFDSFEGLVEDWTGNDHRSGHFDLSGQLPKVEPNVHLIKGWVDDTFQPFLDENDGAIDYLHVDTDTYSPAKTILDAAKPRLVPGSLILFDELFGYPGWENHEFKALNEVLPEDCYEWIGFSQMEAALRVTKSPV